jgi:O-antigen ligase
MSDLKIWIKLSLLTVIIGFSIIFILENPRFNLYIKYLSDGTFKEQAVAKTGTYRYYIWEKGINVFKQNFWFGVGTGDVKDLMTEKNANGFLKKKHNLHNEFLESFVRLGVFGGVIFLSIFFLSIYYALKTRDNLLLYFFIILTVNYFFESMLDRIIGVLFFCFFVFLLIFESPEKL